MQEGQNDIFSVPVLFMIFNRPDATFKVFHQIRKIKPARLYISADGPRNEQDRMKCEEARRVTDLVDWPCEVRTKYEQQNLNCGRGPHEAMNWFFENEEAGIILEDDCLPSLSFFSFCRELLERYKDDERIMMISGDNFLQGWKNDPDYSYFFSNFSLNWGWATWRRAWKLFDFTISRFPEIFRKKFFDRVFLNSLDRRFRLPKLIQTYHKREKLDWWDYQWQYALLTQSGYCIAPIENLIKNIGFDKNATHTKNAKDINANMETSEMSFPLKHPDFVMHDAESDKRMLKFFVKAKIASKLLPVYYFWFEKERK